MFSTPTTDEIKAYFPYFQIRRLDVFCAIVFCIIQKQTVNINKLKNAFGRAYNIKDVNVESVYRRLTRFFNMSTPKTFCICISYLIINLLIASGQTSIYWAIDRTNWQIGDKNKVNCNLLTLGLVLNNGCFIPIIGVHLDKKGNSNMLERIDLINDLVKLFLPHIPKPINDVKHIILGDREFVGKQWLLHLVNNGFSFVMRLRKDDYLQALAKQKNTTIYKLKRKIKSKVVKNGFFYAQAVFNDKTTYFLALPNSSNQAQKKDKIVYFLSDLSDIKQISDAYYKRWQIEVYFKHCKTNGFNLEDLNLKKEGKILLMTVIVGFTYVLAIFQGMYKLKNRPIKKQYYTKNNKNYNRIAIFTLGCEQLEVNIFDIVDLIQLIQSFLPEKPVFNSMLVFEKFKQEYFKSQTVQ